MSNDSIYDIIDIMKKTKVRKRRPQACNESGGEELISNKLGRKPSNPNVLDTIEDLMAMESAIQRTDISFCSRLRGLKCQRDKER